MDAHAHDAGPGSADKRWPAEPHNPQDYCQQQQAPPLVPGFGVGAQQISAGDGGSYNVLGTGVTSPSESSSTPAPSTASASQSAQPGRPHVPQRRAFKACLNCRQRKARCDLGDIDSPGDPPCARCRREGRECVFAASRRGGRGPLAGKKGAGENGGGGGVKEEGSGSGASGRRLSDGTPLPPSIFDSRYDRPKLPPIHSLSSGFPGAAAGSPSASHSIFRVGPNAPSPAPSSSHPHPSVPGAPSPSSLPSSLPSFFSSFAAPASKRPDTAASSPHDGTATTTTTSSTSPTARSMSGSTSHPPYKRRRTLPGAQAPVDPERLAAASLRNPADALNILALASAAAEQHARGSDEAEGSLSGEEADEAEDAPVVDGGGGSKRPRSDGALTPQEDGVSPSHHHHHHHHSSAPPSLASFELIKRGVLTPAQLASAVEAFFKRHHFVFPIIPAHRIPKNEADLARFARDEPHLLTAFVVIASRHDRNSEVHDKSWAYMQTLINDLMFGKAPSVGAVEALLLLSENIPRQRDTTEANTHAEENRMAWMLVGNAVRIGYFLGLDQKTLLPTQPPPEDPEDRSNEALDRERLAWTYCYLFDRQISIRVGKAFWSRGPGLCFQTSSAGGSYPSAADNFPSLRLIPGSQDDFSSLVQAYVELTQTMTSAHDILYPSKDRTIALVKIGEYYKYLDEFTRAINGFKIAWEGKRWATFPLTELVWITYHYLRLYIFGFSFQAHVQRQTSSPTGRLGLAADQERTVNVDTVVFPRGPIASPDAKFILEAIDAASDLLRICTDRLHPGGALPYLPWRFYLYFSYAGVFLLKAVFVGAVVPQDQRAILKLVKRLILCLACASTDEQHPGVRHARLLNGLLRTLSRGSDHFVSAAPTGNVTPVRRSSPERDVEPRTAVEALAAPPNWPAINGRETNGTALSRSPRPAAAGPAKSANGNARPDGSSIDATLAALQLPSTSAFVPQNPAFPLVPFTETQPFHLIASALDKQSPADLSDFQFDFDLNLPHAPDAFSQFLSDEHALDSDFWRAFSAQSDAAFLHGEGAGANAPAHARPNGGAPGLGAAG